MNTDFLNHIESESEISNDLQPANWCITDRHSVYESFSDFNEWLESDEASLVRIDRNLEGFVNPSKAFFSGDRQAYLQEFKAYRESIYSEILSETFLNDAFNGDHWSERNRNRFEQLLQCLLDEQVVPFIGAGVSVAAGFPTWANHLRQQGMTAGINPDHIEELLSNGQYETVLDEIENERSRDVFIQEIRDSFSMTGNLEDIVFRITELFSDTLITTNYDRTIELALDTGSDKEIEVMGGLNPIENPDQKKTTVIKLHGSIKRPNHCILSKNQYDQAYGEEIVDLSLPIPKLLSYYYKTSSLLFLGCSLNKDRTMDVFKSVKDSMGDQDRFQHFSIEQAPETEEELIARNKYLLDFGITAIWFETGAYHLIESILRFAGNEVRYRNLGTTNKKVKENKEDHSETIDDQSIGKKKDETVLESILSFFNLS